MEQKIESRDDGVRKHYELLLGLTGDWEVEVVRIDRLGMSVEIELVSSPRAMLSCPECGRGCPRHDHAESREWRHLDTMHLETILRARVPRVRCAEHGVRTISIPWAEPGSRWTRHFEAQAIEALCACTTVSRAAKWLRLGWEAAHRIMARAVERGLARRDIEGIDYVGMDEKSFMKGSSFVSVMCQLDEGHRRILEVVEGRDQASGEALWKSLPQETLKEVKGAAMDMAGGFVAATVAQAPHVAIVHDKYHISAHLNEGVNLTRQIEQRDLLAQGDETLTGTRQLWLFNPANLSTQKEAEFKLLLEQALKTGEAWAYKELFADFWIQSSAHEANLFFQQWFTDLEKADLPAMLKKGNMIKKHLKNLLTYFTHPITNALAEGFNSAIQALKAAARGFKIFAHYRIRILFFLGRLDLRPELI